MMNIAVLRFFIHVFSSYHSDQGCLPFALQLKLSPVDKKDSFLNFLCGNYKDHSHTHFVWHIEIYFGACGSPFSLG